MNINELTIGQAKDIAAMFAEPQSSNLYSRYIGQYVIVRSRNEGINAGEVVEADETGIILKGARRLWYHRPAVETESWYEGVANHGLSGDSKISSAVEEKAIVENYSVTLVTDKARASIKETKAHGQ